MDKKQIDNLPRSGGIYIIRNMVTDMVYIGKTPKIRQRLTQLLNLYSAGVIGTQLLYDMSRTGLDCFSVEVVNKPFDCLTPRGKNLLNNEYENIKVSYHQKGVQLYPETDILDTMIEVANRHKELWLADFLIDTANWVSYLNWDTGAEFTEISPELMAQKLNVSVDEIHKSLKNPDYLVKDKFDVYYFNDTRNSKSPS